MESIDWTAGPVNPVVGVPLSGLPEGVTGDRLVRCAPFLLDRYQATGPLERPGADTLSIWLVVAGAAELVSADGRYGRTFRRGETVLIPAAAGPLTWLPAGDDGPPVNLIAARRP